MNLPARIPTRKYHDMNLTAHIIMCSSSSMNLPAHGTKSPDPSLTSQHDNKSKKSSWLRYRLGLPKRRQEKILRRLPSGSHSLPDARL